MFRSHFVRVVLVLPFAALTLQNCGESDSGDNASDQSLFPLPDTSSAVAYTLHPDSLTPPVIVPVDTTTLTRNQAGEAELMERANQPVIPGYSSQPLLPPEERRPGTSPYLAPVVTKAKDSTIIAGIPESVEAAPAHIRDNNPNSFSSYGKLNGLPHGNVSCIFEDDLGNLWIGTIGGGMTCFNGSRFTTFSEDQGLCFNGIWTICEDNKKNIWIGTYGRGISKYDGKNFTTVSTAQGLPHNQVWAILEDRSGTMWFGTAAGLCSFDGKTFTTYTTEQGLSNNIVLSLYEDSSGLLWIGTGNGLCSFNGDKFLVYSPSNGMSGTRVWVIDQTANGDLWIGTEDGGVNRFDGKTFRHFTTTEGLPHNCVTSIQEDADKYIWIGTLGGLCRFDGGKELQIFTEKDGLSSDKILDIHQDRAGNLWFGTVEGGICRYNGKVFGHYAVEQGLPSQVIWSVHQDRDGGMWFGSEGGVIKGPTAYYSKAHGLSDEIILSIYSDPSENIWLGTYGSGVTRFDGSEFVHFTTANGLPNNRIWSILEDDERNIWMATYGGGAVKFDGTRFHQYTLGNGLSDSNVFCIHKDPKGNLWFGTENGGLTCLDTGGHFSHYNKKGGLPNNRVWCLDSDGEGNLWFGTFGGGLSKFDGKTFTNFTEREGLASNFVFALTFDAEGNLWAGTRQGLSCLRKEIADSISARNTPTRPYFVNFGYADGFYGMGVIGGGTMASDRMGNLWIGSNDRLTRVDPKRALSEQPAPEIEIYSLDVFNEHIGWTDLEQNPDSVIRLGNGVEFRDYRFDSTSHWNHLPVHLNLAHHNNYLTFGFTGITHYQPEKLKYRYKLDGHDEQWSGLTSEGEVTYGNLPEGDYVFKVKAMNSQGTWSGAEEFQFTIRPPWWRTLWFRTLSIVLILLSLIGLYRWRTASLRRRQAELEHTVVERTREVVAEKKESDRQRHEAERQRELVEEKQKEILDSITYARRIQRAILPTDKLFQEKLPRSFLLYRPKDIVAGDFYWMMSDPSNPSTILFAVADCTGHGVPGALVSMVCHNGLNRAVKEYGLTEPGKILDKTREIIVAEFEKSDENVKDGMDIALCSLNHGTLKFSGAHNPLWIVRRTSDTVEEIKADSQPVGKFDHVKPYTTHSVELEPGDQIYLFSDGFSDQFGGEKGKKFKSANLKKLLLSIRYEEMEVQKQMLTNNLVEWMGHLEQVDDVCVIGVRI